MLVRLVDLGIDNVGVVTSLNNSNLDIHRLIDMGVTIGSKVRLVNKTANKGPIEIKVRDYYIALRYNLASPILVDCEE